MEKDRTFTSKDIRRMFNVPVEIESYDKDRTFKLKKAFETSCSMQNILNKTEGKGILYRPYTQSGDLYLGIQFQLGVDKIVDTLTNDLDKLAGDYGKT